MAVAVPSRFACLKIEDDDYRPKTANKVTNGKGKKPDKPEVKNGMKKPIPMKNGKKVNTVNKQIPITKTSKKKKETAEQWEQWKEKDNEFVDGNFEEDLQNAILLSKLDYEEKKDFYKQNKKELGVQHKNADSVNKKIKKKKVMSLDQFNTLVSGDVQPLTGLPEVEAAEFDDGFFERIKCEAREEVQREQSKQVRRSREPYNDAVTIAQFQAELEKQRAENKALRQELDSARADIITVKCRNKKLCSLLGQGEMRDKAEVLLEVERLTRVQNELTGEVTRLHGLLEQERSKVGALTHDPRHKDKNKKRTNSETAPQSK